MSYESEPEFGYGSFTISEKDLFELINIFDKHMEAIWKGQILDKEIKELYFKNSWVYMKTVFYTKNNVCQVCRKQIDYEDIWKGNGTVYSVNSGDDIKHFLLCYDCKEKNDDQNFISNIYVNLNDKDIREDISNIGASNNDE